jgi:hypothetical protein
VASSMSTQVQSGGRGVRDRAQAGGVPRIARRHRGEKFINLIIAVARAGGGQKSRTSPSPMVPSWHKKEEKKGRFGVGAGLRNLGSFVNSETRHREDLQPNLGKALGSVKR